MNPEIKTKWIEALRSGKYKQGRLALRRPEDTFCCLGVLCDIYSNETGEPWSKPHAGSYEIHGRDGYLPDEVMDWAGLEDPAGPSVTIDIVTFSLAGWNDSGKTFEEIAKMIEENL